MIWKKWKCSACLTSDWEFEPCILSVPEDSATYWPKRCPFDENSEAEWEEEVEDKGSITIDLDGRSSFENPTVLLHVRRKRNDVGNY